MTTAPEFAGITLNSIIHGADRHGKYRRSDPTEGIGFRRHAFLPAARRNTVTGIEGDASEGHLAGTLYAKWAHVKLAGQGTYDAQFVVGSMEVTGSGVVTIKYAGTNLGKAPQIFLVE